MGILKNGTKVVPFQKTARFGPIGNCHYGRSILSGKLKYLYVTGYSEEECCYILNENPRINDGNFYKREDFKLYEEVMVQFEELDKGIKLTNGGRLYPNQNREENFIRNCNDPNGRPVWIDMGGNSSYDVIFKFEDVKNIHEYLGKVLNFCEDKTKPIEMTIEEIEEKLGHKIKIK